MFSCLLGSHRYLDIRHRDRRLGIIADDRVGRILSALIDSCERRPVNDDIAELPVARMQKCLAGFLRRLVPNKARIVISGAGSACQSFSATIFAIRTPSTSQSSK